MNCRRTSRRSKLGSQTLILLNIDRVVKDLLDKRSQNTSTRMDMFLREFGGHNQMLMQDNDETWRRQRKMYHVRLDIQQVDNYTPYVIGNIQPCSTLSGRSGPIWSKTCFLRLLKRPSFCGKF